MSKILETLALLAEGNRISSLTRAKGFKEDTILEWLREAAAHIEPASLRSSLAQALNIRKARLSEEFPL